ncbi:MAG TPA: choice-of-anchor D domain-containing protein [Myxococcales bacterium]|nr:choice-of-anchor D domain-containing protein [Myxococcales bacterium]
MARRVLLGFAVALAGCQCSHAGGGGNGGGLVGLDGSGEAQNLDFGEVPVGQSKTQSLSVKNPGTASVTLEGLTVSGTDASDFHQQSALANGTVAAGATLQIPFVFTPSAAGARSATLTIGLAGAPSLTVAFTGVGAALTVTAAPNPVDFGDVQLGAPAGTATVQLTNPGNVAAQAQLGRIQGPQAGEFGVEGSGGPIPAGGSLALDVAFLPTSVGAASASLPVQICSSDPSVQLGCTTLTLALQGTGVDSQLTFTPDPVSFGTVPAGTSATMQVTVQNGGTADVTLSSLATGSGSSAVFALQGLPSFPADLPAGQSLSITVQYTATGAAGGDSDTLVASYLASGTVSRQASDPLLGNAVLTPCALTLTPASLSFGTVAVGTQAVETLGLANGGETACTISAIALAAGSDPAFAVDPATPATLSIAPGGTGSLSVDFLVASALPPLVRNGTLTFQSTDPNQPTLSVPLTATLSNQGFPCSLTVSPASLNWGTVSPNTPTGLQVLVTNVGSQSCQVSSIALSTTTDPTFTLASSAGFSLAAGQANGIGVQFDAPNASAPNLHTGDLLFATTDPTQPNVDVPLTAQTPTNTPYAGGWPKWHNDNTDEGLSAADTSKLTGTVAWKFPVGAPGPASTYNPVPSYANSPVVDGTGNVYQVGMSGTLYAVNGSGSQLWTAALESPAYDPHPATPIIAKDGTLFIETGADGPAAGVEITANLYHVAANGSILSTLPASGAGDGFDVCPSISNGGLLFDGDDSGGVYDFAIQPGGTLVQQSLLALPILGSYERVALAIGPDDTSYWCSGINCEAVSPPAAGFQPLSTWPASGVQPVAAAAGVTRSNVASDLALDVQTGYVLAVIGWSADSVNGQNELVALNATTGQTVWSLPMPQGPLPCPSCNWFTTDYGNSTPAVAKDGTVYVGNLDGLYAVDGATGTLKPGFPFKSADVDSAPAIGGDGTVFFGTADGSFYAVNPDGSQRFKVTTGGRVSSSPAIGPDGTVFFVSDDGNLYAIK